eukprot:TRINITY_DN1966_c0_g1_i1.p1 TRINITY_DN1966_c0_g1~~TRINITY_DN1966_c0_g1_i1.p1  ORF type:complete len:215 (-),score=46.36 TRINITY_DN1966_c0_g1_i1:728-1372(-)
MGACFGKAEEQSRHSSDGLIVTGQCLPVNNFELAKCHRRSEFKIVFLGDSGVGKTNLLQRFCSGEANPNEKATVGVEFATSNVPLPDGSSVKLSLWDTAGQERYRSIAIGYFRGALGALAVFDITRRASFVVIARWLEEFSEKCPQALTMLVGNKTDLRACRQVPTEEAARFAKERGMAYIETSARDGSNVRECFAHLAGAVAQHLYGISSSRV